jgi:tRNA dimethylallyltransferase
MLPTKKIIFLMGPTASGKTALALDLAQHLPVSLISVDSAMVYRGLDIGTAKPSPEIQQNIPHHLIDICDPTAIYSAGQFRQDALCEIEKSISHNKIPLLVGGTMLYFRVLQQGMADLPVANIAWREQFQYRVEQEGWEKLYAELSVVDPVAAARIQPQDKQRIQRALEVYYVTGKNISLWQKEGTNALTGYTIYAFAVAPLQRNELHARIAQRLQTMLAQGFMDEVKKLYTRDDLSLNLPSIRSVGYRQAWEYLLDHYDYETMCQKILAATRQLAKRQLTWLRSWPDLVWLESDAKDNAQKIMERVM